MVFVYMERFLCIKRTYMYMECDLSMEWLLCTWSGFCVDGMGCVCMEWVACGWNGLQSWNGFCVDGMGCVCMKWVACAWNGLRVHEWVTCAWNGLRVHGMGCVCMEWVACAWNGLRVHGMEYICAGHDIFVYIICPLWNAINFDNNSNEANFPFPFLVPVSRSHSRSRPVSHSLLFQLPEKIL